MATVRGRRAALEIFQISDFSGGWNPRDAPSELSATESPDCLNITLDERGGVVKRLGLYRLGSGVNLTSASKNTFYWPTEQLIIVQDGATVKKTSDFVTFTSINTFSTSDRVAYADFKGKLIIAHPVDGVFSYTTGGGFSARLGSPVKGNCMAVWQNKIWVAGDSSNPPRVWWSNAGDETTWTTATDWVDVREVDGTIVTGLGAGQQMDVTAKPTLLVFKKYACHRINDSTSGSYTTLSASDGAANPLCITSLLGRTYFTGPRGIFYTDGVAPPVRASQKISPLFNNTQLDYSRMDNWAMGVAPPDRVLLSVTRQGSSTNNLTVEHSPVFGWFVPHSFGIASFALFTKSDELCYGASPTAGKIFQVFRSGADDGVAITSRFQTRWLEPNAGHQLNVRRMIVEGRGTFDLYFKTDYSVGIGELNSVVIAGGGFTWGTDVWGAGVWGPLTYESYESFYSLGVCRSASFVMTHTGTNSIQAPKLLQDGGSVETGAFACYGIDLEFVRLGYA